MPGRKGAELCLYFKCLSHGATDSLVHCQGVPPQLCAYHYIAVQVTETLAAALYKNRTHPASGRTNIPHLYTMLASDYVAIAAVAIAFVGIYVHRRRSKPSHLYPPGPKPLPFIGNILDIPQQFQWRRFCEWKGIYGTLSLPFRLFR